MKGHMEDCSERGVGDPLKDFNMEEEEIES